METYNFSLTRKVESHLSRWGGDSQNQNTKRSYSLMEQTRSVGVEQTQTEERMNTMRQTTVCSMVAAVGVSILMSGCASMNLSKDLTVSTDGSRIGHKAALYASPEAQAFVVEGARMGRSYRIPVGEALLPNAQRCLADTFDGCDIVQSVPASKGEEYTVELDFPEKGQIDIGLTSFSASPVTLSVRARVRTGDGEVTWEKTARTTASAKSRWQIAAIIPIFGALGHDSAIVLAAEKSLQQSLQEIKDSMLKDRDIILKGKAR